MPRKPLEWSTLARDDLRHIVAFYGETAGELIAARASAYLLTMAETLTDGLVTYRKGLHGAYELVLSKFPFTIVYLPTSESILIVRVLHQSCDYFNE
jgi:plasmid stabilization system protein ParE